MMKAGRNGAFTILFDYTSGDSQGRSRIAITLVEGVTEAEKIAMTVSLQTGPSER
jgi:hypothetical protein